MKSLRYLAILLLLVSVTMLQACGGSGGGGDTNASMVFSVSSATVPAGKTVNGSVVIASLNGKSVSNLTPTIVSDTPDVIPSFTPSNGTNQNGLANISISSRNVRSSSVIVRLYATIDGVRSNDVVVTVRPAILTLSPPADNTFTVTSVETSTGSGIFVCSGGIVRLVVSGAQATFADSSTNPVVGQPIELSVKSITNYSGFEQVIFWPGDTTEVTIPPFTTTQILLTDTNGKALLPIAIDGPIPGFKGFQNVFAVNWEAKTQVIGDNGQPIIYTDTKQTLLTNLCN